jgi:hypothetical protein
VFPPVLILFLVSALSALPLNGVQYNPSDLIPLRTTFVPFGPCIQAPNLASANSEFPTVRSKRIALGPSVTVELTQPQRRQALNRDDVPSGQTYAVFVFGRAPPTAA